MNKVLIVVRKEYLERVRSKSFVIGTLLGPLLMSLFILLPMLLADTGDAYLAKILTDKGEKLMLAAGWDTAADAAAGQQLDTLKQAAESRISAFVATDGLKQVDTILGGGIFFMHKLRNLHLRMSYLLVFRYPG